MHEWTHACAILKQDFSAQWEDVIALLTQFRLNRSQIVNLVSASPPCRRRSIGSFTTGLARTQVRHSITVDEETIESPTHKVDCGDWGQRRLGPAEIGASGDWGQRRLGPEQLFV